VDYPIVYFEIKDFTLFAEIAGKLTQSLDFSSVLQKVAVVNMSVTEKLLLGTQPYRQNEVMRFFQEYNSTANNT